MQEARTGLRQDRGQRQCRSQATPRMKYLLDTDICVYLMKRRPPQVERRFARLHVGDAIMSVITHGELMVGCHKLPDTPAADLRRSMP